MDMKNKNINDSIKIMAAAAGLSLADVARAVGDSPQSLNQRFKTGKLQKDLDYIKKLSAACGFSFDYDFTESKNDGVNT